MNQFSSREIAVAFWGGLFLLWAFSKAEIRSSTKPLLNSLRHPKIAIPALVMLAYVVAVVAVLAGMGYWSTDLLKDTVVWFFMTATVFAFHAGSSRHDEPLLRRVVRESVTVVIVLEFLTNVYSMPLWAELVTVPIMVMIVLMDTVAAQGPQFALVKRVTGAIIVAFGLAVMTFTVVRMVQDFAAVYNTSTLRALSLPIVLSACFVPFALLLGAYSTYETMFLRISLGGKKPPEVVRYAKWQLLVRFRFDLGRAHRFMARHALDLMQLQSRRDVQNLLLAETVENVADRRANVGTWTAAAGEDET